MYKVSYLLALLLVAQATYFKMQHQLDPQAVCLDGSPSALYVFNGTDPTKIIIHFNGVGTCADKTGTANTLKACRDRSKTNGGSSTLWPWTVDDLQGMMSASAMKNPTFANWTKVSFIYCDGMLHQGYRKEAVPYNGTNIYFRGDRITKAHFKYLNLKYALFANVTDIIMTGDEMGSISAYMWANYLQKQVKGTVHTVLDSGIYLNQINYLTKAYDFQEIIKNIVKLVNIEVNSPFEECNSAYGQNQFQCFMFQYAYPYLKGRVMVVNSMYDPAALKTVLGSNCIKGNDLTFCLSVEIQAIEGYHSDLLRVLNVFMSSKNGSVWGIACAGNNYLSSDFYFSDISESVPAGSGETAAFALYQWMNGLTVRMIDTVNWPSNYPCAHVRNNMQIVDK